MFPEKLRWTPPAPMAYYQWDGKSIDLLQAILDRDGNGWTAEFNTSVGDPEYVEIFDGSGNRIAGMTTPGGHFRLNPDGTFAHTVSLSGTAPYPTEWL